MPHVSLITLGVDDLAAATAFYAGLGWRTSSASVPDTVTFLQGDNVALGLFGRADLAADAGLPPQSPAAYRGVALATNLATPAAVDELLAAAGRAGGRIVKPAEATDWGGYSGYFTDLDGHLWEVAHNPFFELLADGRVDLPFDA